MKTPGKPEYVREYENLLAFLSRVEPDEERRMARAVGGSYHETGRKQRALLEEIGLKDGDSVIDVGCGSGRTANGLKDLPRLSYLGTDVLQPLLDHAKNQVARSDWRFEQVRDLVIPAPDGAADFVLFFSVFTHLTTAQSFTYLKEARRVLKAGGRVVFSYLDRNERAHTSRFRPRWLQLIARLAKRDVRIQFVSDRDIARWLEGAKLVETRRYGGEKIGHYVIVAVPASDAR